MHKSLAYYNFVFTDLSLPHFKKTNPNVFLCSFQPFSFAAGTIAENIKKNNIPFKTSVLRKMSSSRGRKVLGILFMKCKGNDEMNDS